MRYSKSWKRSMAVLLKGSEDDQWMKKMRKRYPQNFAIGHCGICNREWYMSDMRNDEFKCIMICKECDI